MKIVGIVQFYNEERHDNLHRCLSNMEQYCDEIVVYDDGSTDNSVSVAQEFTKHIISSPDNDFMWETKHKQQLLEHAVALDADYICWLDADEVFDREATQGGIRHLCEDGVSWEFYEITLWRSQTWRRLDIWEGEKHPRLWKVKPGIHITEKHGLHNLLVPPDLDVKLCPHFHVIHYGFSTKESIERRWRARSKLGQPIPVRRHSVDERSMRLERVPPDKFPPGITVPVDEPRPTRIRYGEDIMKEAGF